MTETNNSFFKFLVLASNDSYRILYQVYGASNAEFTKLIKL
jgi:hypothetical protein